MTRLCLLALVIAGCGDESPPIAIVAPAELAEPMRDLVALTPGLVLAEQPSGLAIELVLDLSCRECYRIDEAGPGRWTVHASDVLGAQYGTAHALENLGYWFRHPFDTYVPDVPAFAPTAALGVLHEPRVPGQRGLQLHTLHPIEAYFSLWESGDPLEARRIFDWIVKNRGNHVQWPALDDIMDPARHAECATALVEHAHLRGLTVGLGVQIFGSSPTRARFRSRPSSPSASR